MDLVKPYDIHFGVTKVAMRTQGLNHIQIAVSDTDLSLAFYTGLLGMRELFRDGPLVFLQSAEGRDIVTLRQVEGTVDSDAGGLQHFGFTVKPEDHAAAVDEHVNSEPRSWMSGSTAMALCTPTSRIQTITLSRLAPDRLAVHPFTPSTFAATGFRT